MAIQQLAHATLRVNDIEAALEFHTGVLGLVELGRDRDRIFLGCGLDDGVDVVLGPGGTGVAAVAMDVTSAEDLEHYERRLRDLGVAVSQRTNGAPGVERSIAFEAPSGHQLELLVPEEGRRYLQVWAADRPRGRGVGPLDVDHISLVAPDVRALVEFLQHALDFHLSDVVQPAPGFWAAGWTRSGTYHHDIAIVAATGPSETLHHLAWTMESMDHIKHGLDLMAAHGHMVEVGPGRHSVGSNLYAYFHTPGGNRYEFSAEMPRLTNPLAPPNIWTELIPQGFSAWGHQPPDDFRAGS